jgi:anti-anti-sigma factor
MQGPSDRDVVRVVLDGELDIATAPEAEQRLREAGASPSPVILVDLRELTFIDSTGLRILIAADSRAREDGRRFIMVRGRERVDRVFRIALLDTRLEFVDAPEELEPPA